MVARIFRVLRPLALALTVLLAGLGLWLARLTVGLPDVTDLTTFETDQTTRVFARDGQIIATLFAEKRTPVSLDKVSPTLIKALLAVEDSRFYQHHGVDWWGVGRAFFANVILRRVDQGASTLTMQLARNRFLTQDLSLSRKVREMMLAQRIEQHYSKEKILEYYLNHVYFGSGAYGITSASRLYFGRSPDRLSLAQAALLAGLVQAPSQLSPLVHRQAALERMKTVLGRMRETGLISGELYQQALQEGDRFQFGGGHHSMEPLLKYPYYTTYILADLAQKIPEEQLYRGGLRVTTTLDVGLQRMAEDELRQTMAESGAAYQADNAALVLIENSTGAIRAMVGGRGWSTRNQFNRAWQAQRQPGSSFKPFVYAAALQDGLTPDSLVEDSPLQLGNWNPQNSDGRFMGSIPMRDALRHSRNVVAVRLCQRVGPEKVVQLAHALGVSEPLNADLSLALGSCDVSPLSMASAYSTIASLGFYRRPLGLVKVLSPRGETMLDQQVTRPVLVLLPETASQLLEMMMGVVRSGTGTAAQIEGVDVAGKTGTTDDFRDAWFVGSTPDYTLAVWVGNDDHSPMVGAYGGGLPATLWRRVMQRVLAQKNHQKRFALIRPLPVAGPRQEGPLQLEPAPEPEVVDEVPQEEESLPPIIPWEAPSPTPEEPAPETPSAVEESPSASEEPAPEPTENPSTE